VPVAPATSGQVRTAYASRFAPDSLIAALAGLLLLVVGLIAVVRGGFNGPMSDPVVSVIGFTHTTLLGLIEITIGLCLLLSGAARSRTGEVFFGAVLGIGAFVGAVQTDSFKKSLALESGLAWLAVFGAIVVVLAALVMPRFARNSTTIANV
jgi:asparagine N-glycosylation enzyme membrane subunit Stt3